MESHGNEQRGKPDGESKLMSHNIIKEPSCADFYID